MSIYWKRIKIICSVVLLTFTNTLCSQSEPELYQPRVIIKSEVLKKNETVTDFPGGRDSLICFIENIWNQKLINKVDSGIIYISFEVNKSGKVHSIELDVSKPYGSKTTKGLISPGSVKIKSEVLNALESMPKWKPRMIGNRPKKSRTQRIALSFPYRKQCR